MKYWMLRAKMIKLMSTVRYPMNLRRMHKVVMRLLRPVNSNTISNSVIGPMSVGMVKSIEGSISSFGIRLIVYVMMITLANG